MSGYGGGSNAPAIIIKRYELLDTKTNKPFTVQSRKLYEMFLSKDNGRYIKAG